MSCLFQCSIEDQDRALATIAMASLRACTPLRPVDQRVAREALSLWDGLLLSQQAYHHRITVKFLSPDSRLREQLVLCSNGAKITDSTEAFQFEVALLKTVPVVSRITEAHHKDIKKRVGLNKPSLPLISLSIRGRCILGEMKRNPDFLEQFLPVYDIARRPRRTAVALGVAAHPDLPCRGQHHQTTEWIRLLVNIFYRCDLPGQFADKRPEKKVHAKDLAKEKQSSTKEMASAASQQRESRPQRIWGIAMLDHFRTTVNVGATCSLRSLADVAARVPGFRTLDSVLCDPMWQTHHGGDIVPNAICDDNAVADAHGGSSLCDCDEDDAEMV